MGLRRVIQIIGTVNYAVRTIDSGWQQARYSNCNNTTVSCMLSYTYNRTSLYSGLLSLPLVAGAWAWEPGG